MEVKPRFNVVYLEDAVKFLQSLDAKVQDKINYNIMVSRYEMKQDLFKKLVGTEIWEFRTLYNGIAYRLFAFLGQRHSINGCCHSWHNQENTKDPKQRNQTSRRNNESLLQFNQ